MIFRKLFKIKWLNFSHNEVVERTSINQLLLVVIQSWELMISIDFGIFFLNIFVFYLNGSSEIKMHLEGLYSLSSTALSTKQY